MKPSLIVVPLVAALSASCGKSQSTTTPTPTAASPTITETFTGTLPVGGARFYAFGIPVYGTVNATLVSVGGPDVPSDATVTLGIGSPTGSSCYSSTPMSVSTG